MNAIEITCTPSDGIRTVSPETVGALDLLALTLPLDRPWRVDVHISPDVMLSATPATESQETTS